MLVNRHSVVVQRRRLQDDARRAHQDGQREDPQEQPVQHHRHVLPIFFYLKLQNYDGFSLQKSNASTYGPLNC